jgi:hypothetical protein
MQSSNSNNNIKQAISSWFTYKTQIEDLERKVEKCKDIVKNYMDSNDANVVVSDNNIVKRTKHSRISLDTKSIPTDIYSKYSKTTDVWVYKIYEK